MLDTWKACFTFQGVPELIPGLARRRTVPNLRVLPSQFTTTILLVLWLGSYAAVRVLLPMLDGETWVRVAVALAPVVPGILCLWRFIASLRELDELQRRVQLEALAIAFPLALVLLWTLGLLELAVDLSADDWSYRHVWAYLPMFYFAGLAIAWRRYR